MRNRKRRSWYILIVMGLVSLAALLWGGGNLKMSAPAAQAAGGAPVNVDACTNANHGPSFGGTIVVGSGEIECGSIVAFGGSIAIDGEVRGSIVAFNSDVVISGTINGNVRLYGGSLVLQTGSTVRGNVDLYTTIYASGTQPASGGQFTMHTNPLDWLYPFGNEWNVDFWSLVIWEALGFVIMALFPEHVLFVRTTLINRMKRSVLVGLLSILLAPIVLIILVALVIGIPVAIIVGLGLVAAWALGTVSVGWQLGKYLIGKIAPQHNTRSLQIAAGMAILTLAGMLPVIGPLVTVGTGLLGLGAVFLSRFGTRLYGQPRLPAHR